MVVREVAVDGAAAAKAWALQVEGLVGSGCPLGGIHLGEVRSPARGAQAQVAPSGLRVTDPETGQDAVRIGWQVKAVGGEDGAHGQAERGARALLNAMLPFAFGCAPVMVTSTFGRGAQTWTQTARLLAVHTLYGPTLGGNVGGEVIYRVDATFVWQLLSAIRT